MAKKSAMESFLAECIDKIPEGKRGAFEEMMKDEAVAAVVNDRVLARSEFSRQSDALRAERQDFENTVAEANKNIDGWKNWYGEASSEFATVKERLDAYRETYGDLESGAKPKFLTEEAITTRLATELANRDKMAIKFADILTDLKMEHRSSFNERLDTDKLIEFASKRGLPLESAYKEFTSERTSERNEVALTERIKKERDEAVREYATSHKLPVGNTHNDPHPLDAMTTSPKESRDRVGAAVTAWNNRPN